MTKKSGSKPLTLPVTDLYVSLLTMFLSLNQSGSHIATSSNPGGRASQPVLCGLSKHSGMTPSLDPCTHVADSEEVQEP